MNYMIGGVFFVFFFYVIFFFKQKTAYEIYQCDWSSDVCSSDLPRWIRPFMTGVKGYGDTTEGFFLTHIPAIIFLTWTIYIIPFIFVFDIRRVSVVGKGFKFLRQHFLLSVPIIVLAIVTYVSSIGINQIGTPSYPPSLQYRLIQGSSVIIHCYLSLIIFLAAAQILKEHHREPGKWECTECGVDVAKDASVCPKCGADVSEVEDDQLDKHSRNP